MGVREVIAGWDVGILGDADQGIPPMKVHACAQPLLAGKLLAAAAPSVQCMNLVCMDDLHGPARTWMTGGFYHSFRNHASLALQATSARSCYAAALGGTGRQQVCAAHIILLSGVSAYLEGTLIADHAPSSVCCSYLPLPAYLSDGARS